MQPCPRQTNEAVFSSQLEHQSHWRADGTCSYCGSISPESLFAAIDMGGELVPTDKNYKVYVDRPDPDAGKPWVYGTANFPQSGPGWMQVTTANLGELPEEAQRNARIGDWVLIEPKRARRQDKFYFQHLNEEEMQRFIDLFNERKMNIAYPGYFYTPPFFMRVRPPTVNQ